MKKLQIVHIPQTTIKPLKSVATDANNCNWFTFYPSSKYCHLISKCNLATTQSCPDCKSGQSECQAPECGFSGRCDGERTTILTAVTSRFAPTLQVSSHGQGKVQMRLNMANEMSHTCYQEIPIEISIENTTFQLRGAEEKAKQIWVQQKQLTPMDNLIKAV